MEIEVGEYIRTIDGYIRKVTAVNKRGTYDALCYGAYSVDIKYKNSVGISAKKVKAHSKDIIGLIEVGDYVNGQRVQGVSNITGWIDTREEIIYKDCIKSIVTKELYKEMEYRV